jgi:hypothetical protein
MFGEPRGSPLSLRETASNRSRHKMGAGHYSYSPIEDLKRNRQIGPDISGRTCLRYQVIPAIFF